MPSELGDHHRSSNSSIIEALDTKFKVIDVEVENWHSKNGRSTINYAVLTAYVRCASIQQALNIPKKIEVAGHEIPIWHKGLRTCKTCGKKGHATTGHEYYVRRMATHEKQRKAKIRRARKG